MSESSPLACPPAAYLYAAGDRLEDRNTYRYSTFAGTPFLSGWERSRAAAWERLVASAPDEEVEQSSAVAAAPDTATMLERIAVAPSAPDSLEALERLIQRFEVTKRIHGRYSANNRPVDRGDYHDLRLYVRFAELLERRYAAGDTLVPLNTLLKCLDSLCSVQDRLQRDLRGRVARLIELERDHVQALADRVGVMW